MAKKNMLKLAVVVVLSMVAASASYAATLTLSGATSVGGSSFSSSNKVSAYYVSDSGVSTGFAGTAYGIAAAHGQGDKAIASNQSDAKLYFKTTTPGNATSVASAIATNTSFTGTDWTSM
ncbi:hypothetical protein [Trichlorobacter lovleyi]|uniref:Uncharacterized protein n=1 Tax=Trichlorobacter lovleyi (strain ATCC BAA-1151 / DSM 17278 / SZ) TaxID=398767 RepID=B3E3J2_TRIL1|nr:hypothetical protein [Trichlorobacter lovleyi]ACD95811.1 hypothetical protein Glov_2095 [Trichlorobacter lovleyi SZ]